MMHLDNLVQFAYVTFCLIANPVECKVEHFAIGEPMTPMQCIMAAQPEIAKYLESHPKWKSTRITCGPDRKYKSA